MVVVGGSLSPGVEGLGLREMVSMSGLFLQANELTQDRVPYGLDGAQLTVKPPCDWHLG